MTTADLPDFQYNYMTQRALVGSTLTVGSVDGGFAWRVGFPFTLNDGTVKPTPAPAPTPTTEPTPEPKVTATPKPEPKADAQPAPTTRLAQTGAALDGIKYALASFALGVLLTVAGYAINRRFSK